MNVPRLHDATVQTIHLDWDSGVISVNLRVGPNASDFGELRAEGVANFVCPRVMPWGPSGSVNSARVEIVPEGEIVTIEMQSGDVIEIRCADAQYLAANA